MRDSQPPSGDAPRAIAEYLRGNAAYMEDAIAQDPDMADKFAAAILALAAPVPPLDVEWLRDILDRVPPTVERLQYPNPTAREDAYNKGVRDLAEAIARAYAEQDAIPEGEARARPELALRNPHREGSASPLPTGGWKPLALHYQAVLRGIAEDRTVSSLDNARAVARAALDKVSDRGVA